MSARVVVLGAGYAGVSAAKRLHRGGAQVTVVNPRADFVERIRLHQLAVGNHSATQPLSSILPRGTFLIQDTAASIDAESQTVTLSGGGSVNFDYLVYAIGSRSRLDVLPGAGQYAVTVGDLDAAVTAQVRLAQLPRGSAITLVGAGLTGIELASELAELGTHTVRLVSDGSIAPSVSDKARGYLRNYLAKLGVEVIEDNRVTEVAHSKIVLADGGTLKSDLTAITAMFELPMLARDSRLPVDASGALRVEDTLISLAKSVIVGAGDSVRIDGHPLRMSCQAAIPLGAHAAETVLHLIAGTEPKPVRAKFTGQCISLGRRSGLIQPANFADVPSSLTLTGRVAALVKEQVCASTLRVGLNPKLSRLSYSWS